MLTMSASVCWHHTYNEGIFFTPINWQGERKRYLYLHSSILENCQINMPTKIETINWNLQIVCLFILFNYCSIVWDAESNRSQTFGKEFVFWFTVWWLDINDNELHVNKKQIRLDLTGMACFLWMTSIWISDSQTFHSLGSTYFIYY